jgi:hypothetical protein
MEAITDGVRQAILRIADGDSTFNAPHELFYDAIRQAVKDAVFQIATNATDAPSEDFYDAIRDGIEAAFSSRLP